MTHPMPISSVRDTYTISVKEPYGKQLFAGPHSFTKCSIPPRVNIRCSYVSLRVIAFHTIPLQVFKVNCMIKYADESSAKSPLERICTL